MCQPYTYSRLQVSNPFPRKWANIFRVSKKKSRPLPAHLDGKTGGGGELQLHQLCDVALGNPRIRIGAPEGGAGSATDSVSVIFSRGSVPDPVSIEPDPQHLYPLKLIHITK